MLPRGGGMFALLLITACFLNARGEVLTPPYFNLAERRNISASATCGVETEGPELYCKLAANAENELESENIPFGRGQYCDVCDPHIPEKSHPPSQAIDGKETWWQSPPLSRGMKYNEVNLTIDFGQEFHVAYVFIRMGNSPRPGLWILEKSVDYGKTFTPWQYFSDSPADCEKHFGKESLQPISRDDSVICSTEYSKILPLAGGEIPISLLNNRPSSNHYFNSSVLQEWTRATNVRLCLLRTKNFLGHLMSVARQDPTVTRRYFYSIKDISIGGRCMCNGHADTCYADGNDPKLVCKCSHNTCGAKCESCCPGFQQKAWRQSKHYQRFVCEPCNCFSHSNECNYDPEIDEKGLSLDIHGKYEGGGVCQNCQHNTEGINCNKCKARYYRPYDKHWNETDVCQHCECDTFYSTGNCAEGSGKCECKKEYQEPDCDACSEGYYGYPNCIPCDCHLNGTLDRQCEATNGECHCKDNFAAPLCRECSDGFYNYPECEPCNCNPLGMETDICDKTSGNCTCRFSFGGKSCSECKDGYYAFPTCTYCNCDIKGTKEGICDKNNGTCMCKEGYMGEKCDICAPGFYGYPNCKPCNCSSRGALSTSCDANGKCQCLANFAGRTCDQCSPGFYKFPDCLACQCDSNGANGITCDMEGKCECHHNFDGDKCDRCKEDFYNFPSCEGCNCHPAGVIAGFAGCGSVPVGELCQCKERVEGRICDKCKPFYWNLSPVNSEGCEECKCHKPGVLGGLTDCDPENGQCICKRSVVARGCTDCADGTYNLTSNNLFGCVDCGCNIGGSINRNCDKKTGQCACHFRVMGRTCSEPIKAHYFPTLYQYQYEVEDGYTPQGSRVRFEYEQSVFPEYSWKGYAVFSQLHSEVLQDIQIEKPSLYRMVLRYVNRNPDPVQGFVKIIPDNPSDAEQKLPITFKNTFEPALVTLSRSQPLLMNPGKWTVSIHIEKPLLLDYFVLLPEEFYMGTILNEVIDRPCTIEDQSLCRDFAYLKTNHFAYARGNGGVTGSGSSVNNYYTDEDHLRKLNTSRVPLLNHEQNKIAYTITVPKPGKYVIVINYFTPRGEKEIQKVSVEIASSKSSQNSELEFYACPYTTICRTVVTNGDLTIYDTNEDNKLTVTLEAELVNVAIDSVVAIPRSEFSFDYIKPMPVCIKKDGVCIDSDFPSPPESKKIQFEQEFDSRNYKTLTHNTSKYLTLDQDEPDVDLSGKVPSAGYYVFIIQYHQPHHPELELEVLIQNGVFYETKLPLKFCPSLSGCRSVIVERNSPNFKYNLIESFTVSLKQPGDKTAYLDYLMVIPADLYSDRLLEEEELDRTGEFISTCTNNHFNVNTTQEGFCKDSVFAITAAYNLGALPCHCNYEGSFSFVCDKFGGQCSCKPNIIGRTCDICKMGYYGFPDCKPCNCPKAASCDSETGECHCPPGVTGDQCDQCKQYTYGYHPITGCEDCKCNPLGVKENLQCDLMTGNCDCKENIDRRQCDMCKPGHYYFPYCDSCSCNVNGTLSEICDQNTAECLCKKYVTGLTCDICIEGTYNLQADNEEGCSECFCFGKTTRCQNSDYFFYTLVNMQDWSVVTINRTNVSNLARPANLTFEKVTEYDIEVDFTYFDSNDTVFFAAPDEYLGKKLISYGGDLKYGVYYAIKEQGRAVHGPDVILQGAGTYLSHYSIEQPAALVKYGGHVKLVESSFELPDGFPAKREHIMKVLNELTGIYIRGTYWSAMDYLTLTTAMLDEAYITTSPNYDVGHVKATSVEQCHCPPNYQGTSCEDCAPGYYRVNTGPHGGFCVPCDCNGHADECDVNTGVCINCKHSTRGDHCEQCEVGYHGNARHGTPMDCLICACPIPIASNNFATSCDVSADGEKISCTCQEGYMGGLCQSCSPGYYGKPYEEGDYCKPCQCSGNINPDEQGSCDTITGECLRCLNNTYGQACALCKPGYYGDAIQLKNCQTCICDEYGTDDCDSSTGECKCKKNVEGDKCDRCAIDHYGFQSGQGCKPCECGSASSSSSCDDVTGQCRCKPGVTGRTCDRCAAGFWNYTSEGCISCGCRTQYSLGFGCNAQTGQCECLQNVQGEKCDRCPYRWVFVPDYGCHQCDNCTHFLLDSTDELAHLIDPVIHEFVEVESGYFTNKRLAHINETTQKLKPIVAALDPEALNLKPIIQELESLEQDSKNLNRKTNYSLDNSNDIVKDADVIRKEALDVLEDVTEVSEDALITIKDIAQLSINYEQGEGPKVDSALFQAQDILENIKKNNLTKKDEDANSQLDKVLDLIQSILDYKGPVDDINGDVMKTKDLIVDFNRKLDDIFNQTQYTLIKSQEIGNYDNSTAKLQRKLENIKNQKDEAEDNLKQSDLLLKNATKFLQDAKSGFADLESTPTALTEKIAELNKTLDSNSKDIHQTEVLLPKIEEHADNLSGRAQELDNLLSGARDTSDNAVAAGKAYTNIVNAIDDAQKAAESAKEYVQKASKVLTSIEDESMVAEQDSASTLDDAYSAQQNIEDYLDNIEKVRSNSRPVRSLHDSNVKELEMLENMMRQPHSKSFNQILENAKNNAEEADTLTKETAHGVEKKFNNVTAELNQAKELPKKLDDAKRDLGQVEKQLNAVHDKLPEIIRAIHELPEKQKHKRTIAKGLEEKIKKLNEQIAMARDVAGQITLGGRFFHNTTLELRNPPNIPDLSTSTYISGHFKTPQRNGMIMYLGNPVGTNLKRTKSDDYMALEILNGYPVLSLDIGHGIEQVRNSKYVATDKWYKFIIDRTGPNAKLTIIEELEDGTTSASEAMQTLDGHYSIFNLDRNMSKLCVGSCPEDVQLQEELQQRSYEGLIEDIVIGETPVSLWNFAEAENIYGADERKVLRNLKPSTGYRFNGDGYVILNARQYASLRHRYVIEMKFKTFNPNGLLFLYGKGSPSYISLEMIQGKLMYKFNLGRETKVWQTQDKFNDGEWHKIEAFRENSSGRFKVDGVDIPDNGNVVRGNTIEPSDTIFVGGYPAKHDILEVIDTDFDGCIDNVTISGGIVDLSKNIKAYDVTPGCPTKISRLITLPGHLVTNVTVGNDFRLMLKFKTKEKNGLLFYATNADQSSGISLALKDGYLRLISMKNELISRHGNFNDSEWHVVSVTHNNEKLLLSYDDYGTSGSDESPPELRIYGGNLFIGSLPVNYKAKKGTIALNVPFNGCLGDATLNDNVLNFANYSNLHGGVLGKCLLDPKVGSAGHEVPTLPPVEEIDVAHTTEMSIDQEILEGNKGPSRGDGGKDTGKSTDRPDLEPPFGRTTTLKPKPKSCALPMDPADNDNIEGFRFGVQKDSRLEYHNARGKFSNGYDISLDFKTTSPDGILLYLGGRKDSHFKAMYLDDGHVVYAFTNNGNTVKLTSSNTYNDDSWHRVIYSLNKDQAKLVINDEVVAESNGNFIHNPIKPLFYLGGIDPTIADFVLSNLNTTEQFNGCINSFRMNNKTMENPQEFNVVPCSDNVETGVFFSREPGYIRVQDRYKVGREIVIKMDIKPRNISGLLLSVHGRKDYLILEMIEGTIRFTVDNGRGPFFTVYETNDPYYFCDGNWHSVQAVKSKNVVTLSVDNVFNNPVIGSPNSISTDTAGSLFVGGHRLLGRLKGHVTKTHYIGCMKNIVINDKNIEVTQTMREGGVSLGSCPKN